MRVRCVVWVLFYNCQLAQSLNWLFLLFFFFFAFQSIFVKFLFYILVLRSFHFFLILNYIISLRIWKLWKLLYFLGGAILDWFLIQLIFNIPLRHEIFLNCFFKIIINVNYKCVCIILGISLRSIFNLLTIFFACWWQWTLFILFIYIVIICLYHTFFIFINWIKRLV